MDDGRLRVAAIHPSIRSSIPRASLYLSFPLLLTASLTPVSLVHTHRQRLTGSDWQLHASVRLPVGAPSRRLRVRRDDAADATKARQRLPPTEEARQRLPLAHTPPQR